MFQAPSDFVDMFCRMRSIRPWGFFDGVVAAGETSRAVLDTPEANRTLARSCLDPASYLPLRAVRHPDKMNHASDLKFHLGTLTAEVPI
jgi:hypothetical protein